DLRAARARREPRQREPAAPQGQREGARYLERVPAAEIRDRPFRVVAREAHAAGRRGAFRNGGDLRDVLRRLQLSATAPRERARPREERLPGRTPEASVLR